MQRNSLVLLAGVLAAAFTTGASAQEPEEAAKWRAMAEDALSARLERRINHRRAKNVIVFWADGMGPALTAATRSEPFEFQSVNRR